MHDPNRSRGAAEGSEQVAAGLRRVVDHDRLASEQERNVEVILDERLGTETLNELGGFSVTCLGGSVAGLAALDDGQAAAGYRGDEQHGETRQQAAQPAVDSPDASGLLLGRFAALRHELPLQLV
jgi:hypothetical protein